MKIINFILVFFISFSVLTAQDNNSKKLDNYIEIINKYKYADTYTAKRSKGIKITDEKELKKVFRIIFESNLDPIKKQRMKHNELKKAKLKANGNNKLYSMLVQTSLFNIERMLLTSLRQKYSAQDLLLIAAPLMVKAKILSKRAVSTMDSSRMKAFGGNLVGSENIFCEILVEDIITENSAINIGDKIEIEFLTRLREIREWNTGGSYVFNLGFLNSKDGKTSRYVFSVGENGGYFPVKENIIFDETNFYKQGVQIEWNTFKANIKSRIHDLIY